MRLFKALKDSDGIISTRGIVQNVDPAGWKTHRFGLNPQRWGRLKDKSFWITGAGTGYGRCMAVALASAEAQVFLTGRRRWKLDIVSGSRGLRGCGWTEPSRPLGWRQWREYPLADSDSGPRPFEPDRLERRRLRHHRDQQRSQRHVSARALRGRGCVHRPFASPLGDLCHREG